MRRHRRESAAGRLVVHVPGELAALTRRHEVGGLCGGLEIVVEVLVDGGVPWIGDGVALGVVAGRLAEGIDVGALGAGVETTGGRAFVEFEFRGIRRR